MSGSSVPANAVTTAPPLLLTSDFQWETFEAGSNFSWNMDVEGGVPPYTVDVDWGDSQHSTYVFPVDPTFTISHAYAHSGYFAIKASSVDSRSSRHMMQLAALINPQHGSGSNSVFFGAQPPANSGTTSSSSHASVIAKTGRLFMSSSKAWLWVAWPSLGVVSLMMFSFWLGELQDRNKLLVRAEAIPRRRVSRTMK